MDHITLARWADLLLIAPASAQCLAKLAHGMADDLLSTLCLATSAPIAIAPAMNQQMWKNSATQQNNNTLLKRGMLIWGPDLGLQACGDNGPGRMLEPAQLLENTQDFFKRQPLAKTDALSGIRIMITAGPTQEAIDPIRYISNHSTGRMGYVLAEAAQAAGADVTLISGPSQLIPPPQINFCRITTAQEMLDAVIQRIAHCDIFIAAAAVTDFKPTLPAKQKIKKTPGQTTLNLALETNPDILATVANLHNRPFTVGFAAETEHLEANAQKKLLHKKVDMIAANWVGKENSGFGSENNALTVLWQGGKQEFSLKSKQELAKDLLQLIKKRLTHTLPE
jgi:phosphopantothenoylcysteine decarboxylase/phosphopantothenate--cysteine ligase